MATAIPFPKDSLDPGRTTGLILCGMGGPDRPAAVEPFLRNLFADPLIFPVPRPFGPLVGGLIAKVRAPGVRRRYLRISPDGATPQLPTTRRQAADLARRLSASGRRTVPGVAMRYWEPWPDETLTELRSRGAEQFLVVPTYPQYADATNGSTLGFMADSLRRLAPESPVHMVPQWHLLGGFIEALARPVAETLAAWATTDAPAAEAALLYVAHSLPQKFVDAGDPYLDQTVATVDAVHARVAAALAAAGHATWLDNVAGGPAPLLAFQSRVGPIKWLGPEVVAETKRLAAAGCRRLHVQPVSFTCEHIETLMELDIELKANATRAGITRFSRGAALGSDEGWLAAMADHLATMAFAGGEGTHG
ncbi:MAG: ferrochelatase [bacterium]|nr:ferrochelatase [bacterium]